MTLYTLTATFGPGFNSSDVVELSTPQGLVTPTASTVGELQSGLVITMYDSARGEILTVTAVSNDTTCKNATGTVQLPLPSANPTPTPTSTPTVTPVTPTPTITPTVTPTPVTPTPTITTTPVTPTPTVTTTPVTPTPTSTIPTGPSGLVYGPVTLQWNQDSPCGDTGNYPGVYVEGSNSPNIDVPGYWMQSGNGGFYPFPASGYIQYGEEWAYWDSSLVEVTSRGTCSPYETLRNVTINLDEGRFAALAELDGFIDLYADYGINMLLLRTETTIKAFDSRSPFDATYENAWRMNEIDTFTDFRGNNYGIGTDNVVTFNSGATSGDLLSYPTTIEGNILTISKE